MAGKTKTKPARMAEKIELLKLSELTPYEKNTKIHKSFQVDQIVDSINEFGFTNPILVSKTNGIIAGHGRLMAAKRLKLKQVPVIRLDYLSENQQRAYIIADNKIAENAEWDLPLLAEELNSLDELDFDISKLGFSDEELDKLLDVEIEEDEEESGSGSNLTTFSGDPVTVEGDVWLLGSHRLVCGNSSDVEVYKKATKETKVNMLLTDPPYGVDYETKRNDLNKRARRKGGVKHIDIANDKDKDYRQFFSDFLSIIDFADYNTIYCFLSGQELHNLRLAFDDCDIKWSDYLVWLKNHHVLGRKDYNAKHEFIVYGWKGKHKFYGPSNANTIIEFDKPQKADLHPTMKPIGLLEEILAHGSKRNQVVYDPFAGSGSTLMACENKNRKCIAIELEPKYCDVIIRRWQEVTGEQACLEKTGDSYDKLSRNNNSTGTRKKTRSK